MAIFKDVLWELGAAEHSRDGKQQPATTMPRVYSRHRTDYSLPFLRNIGIRFRILFCGKFLSYAKRDLEGESFLLTR